MNARELLAALRELLDDQSQPFLWSDASLMRKLNNGVREACIRARLLKDDEDSQPKLCRIAVIGDHPIVPYAPEVLMARNGRMSAAHCQLWALTAASMDRFRPGWQAGTVATGEPEVMVMDLAQKRLRLYPTPSVNDTLFLRVWRMPLACDVMRLDDANSKPVIAIPDTEELCHWAAHEAYLVKDAEMENKSASSDHLALFERRFGPRPSLHEMARWADSPPRVRYAPMF